MHRKLVTVLVALALLAAWPAASASGAAPPAAAALEAPRPIVFIHGGAGSGAQFESQAMRFTSNGYPIDHIRVLDYNSLASATFGELLARLDALIAELQAETGADQIDLLGHSLGTGLMQGYLSDPARAARVAHYVNIDGAQAGAPPGGVPTLALWGQGSPTRQIVGATNVYIPDQSHVQIATSRESFDAMYRFFNDGAEPATLDILPEPSGIAELAGRVVSFPANTGIADATLDIYEVDPATGARVGAAKATFALTGDGAFGPFPGTVGKRYELAISRASTTSVHHLYTQPLLRSDHLVRFNSSEPDQGIGALIERGPDHASVVVSRYKEWWGDHPTERDVLEIDGVDVLNGATAPVTKRAIGLLAFDVGSDGVSDLSAPIPALFGLPFLTGVDHYVPATDPPDRTVTVRSIPRGDATNPQVVNVPAFASTDHSVSIHFNDFAVPAATTAFTARFSDQVCSRLATVAAAAGTTVAEVVRQGVRVFGALAEAGHATPAPNPVDVDGPCQVVVPWPAAEVDEVEQTATAWGVDTDDLHHGGGRLVLSIIWAIYANAG